MALIKTSDAKLIQKLCGLKATVKHTSGSLVPGKKVWFFDIDEKIQKSLSSEESKLTEKAKQEEIDNLTAIPKTEHPVTRMDDKILAEELEARGYKVSKQEKEKKEEDEKK